MRARRIKRLRFVFPELKDLTDNELLKLKGEQNG